MVFETWALVSGVRATQAGSEVFRPDGADPGDWSRLVRAGPPPKILGASLSAPTEDPTTEIRMNQAAYEFVRARSLYNLDGVRAAFAEGVAHNGISPLDFPAGAQEVKARWQDLGPAPPASKLARYHWRRIGGHYWVLTGFHIATKDLPNWFWADFEHVDSPSQPTEPFVDSTTRTDHGSSAPAKGRMEGERRELIGTKWAFYRLRGTQTGFTDARGNPTHMASTLIEAGFEHTSCMSCHARATVRFAGLRLTHLSTEPANFDVDGRPPHIPDTANTDLGPPRPSLFAARPPYVQTDFVWSIALRAKPRPAAATSPARPRS
ncbi:MAG: hypothetical protein ACHP7N_00880 [Caulobacterales bacterium]